MKYTEEEVRKFYTGESNHYEKLISIANKFKQMAPKFCKRYDKFNTVDGHIKRWKTIIDTHTKRKFAYYYHNDKNEYSSLDFKTKYEFEQYDIEQLEKDIEADINNCPFNIDSIKKSSSN